MTPEEMAGIHAAAFAPQRGWTAQEFLDLCRTKHVQCFSRPGAFALVRTIADETELLTVATEPGAQRLGLAEALLRSWIRNTTAHRAFLEVAERNAPALRLYQKLGFVEYGRRKGYHARADGTREDAVLMQKALSRRHSGESGADATKTS